MRAPGIIPGLTSLSNVPSHPFLTCTRIHLSFVLCLYVCMYVCMYAIGGRGALLVALFE